MRTLQVGQHPLPDQPIPGQHAATAEGQAREKLAESPFKGLQAPIVIEVFGVYTCHEGQTRIQVQEAASKFVGLHYKDLATSRLGLRSPVDPTPDQDLGIEASAAQDRRCHRSSRRLTVSTGYGEGQRCAGQFPQHLGPTRRGNALVRGSLALGIVGRDGGRIHH